MNGLRDVLRVMAVTALWTFSMVLGGVAIFLVILPNGSIPGAAFVTVAAGGLFIAGLVVRSRPTNNTSRRGSDWAQPAFPVAPPAAQAAPEPMSSNQLLALKKLGYTGPSPQSYKEASAIISTMRAGEDQEAAWDALLEVRRIEAQEVAKRRRDRVAILRQEIREAKEMNRDRDCPPGERCIGFILVATDGEEVSQADLPLVGAIVPLDVAMKRPDLVLRETLDYDPIDADTMIPRSTLFADQHGHLRPLPSAKSCTLTTLIFVLSIGAISAVLYLAS